MTRIKCPACRGARFVGETGTLPCQRCNGHGAIDTATVDKTTASDAAFRARVDAIENAPADEASTVERVARAIFRAANPISDVMPDYWLRVLDGEETRSRYRAMAVAAIDAMKGPQS